MLPSLAVQTQQPGLPPSQRRSTQNLPLPEYVPSTSWCFFFQSWIAFTSIRISKQGSKSPALSLGVRPFSNRFTVKVSTWSWKKRECIMLPHFCTDLFNHTGWGHSHTRDITSHTLHLSSHYRKEKNTGRMRIHIVARGKGSSSQHVLARELESPLSQCSYWYF